MKSTTAAPCPPAITQPFVPLQALRAELQMRIWLHVYDTRWTMEATARRMRQFGGTLPHGSLRDAHLEGFARSASVDHRARVLLGYAALDHRCIGRTVEARSGAGASARTRASS